MNFNGVSNEYMLYGTLFTLSNRIQTLGDSTFDDITMKQHFLLICISVFGSPPSLKDTADIMGCSYQNVKRMALSLEKQGFLQIATDKEDHRKLNLLLTEKVNTLVVEKQQISEKFMKTLFHNLNEADIKTTLETLKKMDTNIREEFK